MSEDKEKKAARYKRWYDAHPPTEERKKKKADQQRLERANKPDQVRERDRERYKKDPEKVAAYLKEWRAKNPDKKAQYNRVHLLRKYGLTLEEYEALLTTQGGGCAICGSTDPGTKNAGCFPVDHDHATGAVRGLLCRACNIGLGLFKDDASLLTKALNYITK